MIWVLFAGLIAASLLPLAPVIRRFRPGQGARAASLAAARAERAELEREYAEGKVDPAQIAHARLEADRRILAADRIAEAPVRSGSVATVAELAAVAVAGGVLLYMASGRPLLPSMHADASQASVIAEQQKAAVLIAALETQLDGRDASDPKVRQGFIYLGQLHADRDEWSDAATAWNTALGGGFEPLLAARAADAEASAAGGLTPHAVTLFKQALEAAPPDAPWREMVRDRLTLNR